MRVPIFNKTKILATVGPACNDEKTLIELVMSGVDIFRLNFSHGDHQGHAEVISLIRKINEDFILNIGKKDKEVS